MLKTTLAKQTCLHFGVSLKQDAMEEGVIVGSAVSNNNCQGEPTNLLK
jgi:hypothetical protein